MLPRLILTLALLQLVTANVWGQNRQAILNTGLNVVNKWLATHQLDCGWEDGTFMIGVAALHNATGDPALRNAILAFGDSFNWNMCVKLGGGAWNPDNQVAAATYAQLYLDSPQKNETWVKATAAQLEAEIAAANSTRIWSWVDAMFMSMSVWARMGAATGKQAYWDKMHKNFVFSALTPRPSGWAFWSRAQSLFYRDPPKSSSSSSSSSSDSSSSIFWSRGNGWAAAAMVQALKYAPAADPQTQTYREVYLKHMARLMQLQGSDGCWRSSLTDPDFYPVPETTGTALFTYSMAYGIKSGLLDATLFTPVVQKSWGCLMRVSLHPDATVGNCQPVGFEPGQNFGRNSTSSFCVGHFALAATAIAQLAEA